MYGNGNPLVQCKCVQDKMKFRKSEIIGARFEQSNLAKVRNVTSTFELTKSIIYKSHLYKTKSCKFELLEAYV